MFRRLPLRHALLAFTVGLMLLAQITGLHRHFHTEAGTPAHSHQNELHFGDAGLHADEHSLQSGDAAATHHAHGDIEVKALGEAFAKFSTDLLPLGLLLIVVTLLAPTVALRLRRGHYAAPAIRPHPFALHPPSNGPPGLSFTLV